MMTNKKMMLDGMMGLVVGDALGCPVQFLSRDQIRIRGKVTEMEGYGTYHMPVGTWTDDSSMALATLASIYEKDGIELDGIMENFVAWEFDGAFTPFGRPFDEGITCSNAIYRYASEKNVNTCGKTGEMANGNGALMRILPVCLYYIDKRQCICTSDHEAIEGIHRVTALTHNHLRSQMADGLYYFMAKAIVDHKDTAGLQTLLQKGLDEGFAYYRSDFANLSEMSRFSRLYDLSDFAKAPEREIKSSGYVLDSIEAAVWCLITTEDFASCLLKAVNLGDDTDTVAAIAGGLAGLYYGYESIPKEWLEVIQKRAWVEAVCQGEITG